jgi:hypothetical protein
MNTEARALEELLRPIVRRLTAAAGGRVLARAVIGVAGVLLLWALTTAVVPLPFPLGRLAPVLAAALAGAVIAGARLGRPSLLAAARLADRRAGLQDRLGTAVDLLSRPGHPNGIAQLQIRDAVRTAAAVEPAVVAPIRASKEAWVAAALCLALVAWARFGAGLTIPGTPAGRVSEVIHREGRVLVDIGRRLDETGRAGRLPEAQRAAPGVEEAGRRLEAPRAGWDEAVAQVRDVARQLQQAQDNLRRRLDQALAGKPPARPSVGIPGTSPASGDRAQRIEAARAALEDLAGALRAGGGRMSSAELARRLRALSDSLDQMGAPPTVRSGVDRARRAAEQGQPGASAAAMADTIQDLRGLERMMGDEQALGDAKRRVERSGERLARAGRGSGTAQPAPQAGRETSAPTAAGPTPPEPGPNGVTPPPGPNQGSRPGQGTVDHRGPATPRLAGTHVPSRLVGLPGTGSTHLREIAAPGRAEQARRAAGRPPAGVAHELDRALSQDPLPPSYLTLVRRYFDTQGGAP